MPGAPSFRVGDESSSARILAPVERVDGRRRARGRHQEPQARPAAVRERLPDIDLFVAVDTLEYRRKNGWLSTARSAIGTMLSIKPNITVRDGLIVMAERQLTRARAREKVIERIMAQSIERLAIIPRRPPRRRRW